MPSRTLSLLLGTTPLKLLADAITRAGSTDSEKLRAAIQDTENFPGVSGKITIGKDRNAAEVCGDHHDQRRSVQVRRDHRAEELKKLPVSVVSVASWESSVCN